MKLIYATFCLGLLTISSFAQKLPDVQNTNLSAPANIKIDGKATEWNDTFAAENKRTNLFYSLANDEKNLYVIIKSGDANKIFLGGITFTINTQGKKRDKEALAITYPLVVRVNRAQGGRGAGQGQGQPRQGGQAQGGFQNRPQQTEQQRDSIALVQHKAQLATVKEIKVEGFKAITDSLISIYNEYGIKAVASFDVKGQFVYELAIPLSLLEVNPTDGKELAYQIKVNGRPATFGGGNGGNAVGNGGGAPRGNGGGNFGGGNFGGGNAGANQDLLIPTDFWGKYILFKK